MTTTTETTIRHALQSADFTNLFIHHLGWDHHQQTLPVEIAGHTYTLTGQAEKRGMAVFRLSPDATGHMPDAPTRRKIEKRVAQYVHEHIIVFVDDHRKTQVWQWVKREPGKPDRPREFTLHAGQSGENLIQRLRSITFSLEEEDKLNLVDVTGRVRAAFDVDRVTKRFYDRFQTEHKAFLGFIKGIQEQGDAEWYASLMLNRLMFVYFIQKKGFLDRDPNYLRTRMRLVRDRAGKDQFLSFYREFLLRLFHEGLGRPENKRPSDLADLLGTVPYLNGGLFDVHSLEENNPHIEIPDGAFERIFDFFDGYEWHLDTRPLRNDKEINPDVLGYIFEKYINQKQMGAYYTKEDITGYIGKNTIIPFLLDAARKDCKIAFDPAPKNPKEGTTAGSVWRLLTENPDRYIYDAVRKGADLDLPPNIAAGIEDVSKRTDWNRPADPEFALPTETWREHVARRQRCHELRAKLSAGEVSDVDDLVTLNLNIVQFAQDVVDDCEGPELLRALYKAIKNVTILDPTSGSGAFLFAALNILEPLYDACLDRMQYFVNQLDATTTPTSEHAAGATSDHAVGATVPPVGATFMAPETPGGTSPPGPGHERRGESRTPDGAPMTMDPDNERRGVSHTPDGVPTTMDPDNERRGVSHAPDGVPMTMDPDNERRGVSHTPGGVPTTMDPDNERRGVSHTPAAPPKTNPDDQTGRPENQSLHHTDHFVNRPLLVTDGTIFAHTPEAVQPVRAIAEHPDTEYLLPNSEQRTADSQQKYPDFRKTLAQVATHPSRQYFILKSIILNNLYGVDIMEEAVEIAKLRLFLTLVAQVETYDQIEPLPDIDFNIRAGNTLVGFATFEDAQRAITSKFDFDNVMGQIKERAEDIERLFGHFRRQQTELGGEITPEDKQVLRNRLAHLGEQLNQYLAAGYGIKTDDADSYASWRRNYQPFHWFVEFYGIMDGGGFDVVIGNPPWREYSTVKATYTVQGYVTERCGNLHNLCTERSLRLRSGNGWLSFIVQLPLTSSARMAEARNLLRANSSSLLIIPFDDRPGRLFEGLEHCRSVIFLSRGKASSRSANLAVTRYQRWPSENRPNLLMGLEFVAVAEVPLHSDIFPKLASLDIEHVFEKVGAVGRQTVAHLVSTVPTDHFVFYQEATQYWVKATAGLPYYAKNGQIGAPAHGRYLYFSRSDEALSIAALLNSSLFYAYFIAYGDCFHLSDKLALTFPVPTVLISSTMAALGKRLMTDLAAGAQRMGINTRDGDRIEYDEYYARESKPVIDEIDAALAGLYGFSESELEAIWNFDAKFRSGPDDYPAPTLAASR